MRLYVVLYMQYGEWYSTMPFHTEQKAQKHIDMVLHRKDPLTGERERDYIKLAQIVPVDVRETER